MASIAETVLSYTDKIEQNKISIKTLQREIDEMNLTRDDIITEMSTLESSITQEIINKKAELDDAIPLDSTTGLPIHELHTINLSYSGGLYGWSEPGTTSYVDHWAIYWVDHSSDYDVDNVVYAYEGTGWDDNSVLTDAITKWNLLKDQIVHSPDATGAYGLDSNIDSKEFAITFLTNENTFMQNFIDSFG